MRISAYAHLSHTSATSATAWPALVQALTFHSLILSPAWAAWCTDEYDGGRMWPGPIWTGCRVCHSFADARLFDTAAAAASLLLLMHSLLMQLHLLLLHMQLLCI